MDAFAAEDSIKLESLEIQDFENLKAELLLRLLILLAEITKDPRSEIRHGKRAFVGVGM